MISLDYLPDKTRNLFQKIADLDFISHYILVGGTALAMQIQHRQSEDLDFIYDGDLLPVQSLKRAINKHFKNHYKIIKDDNGYQIDFLIDDVKTTFFSSGAVQVNFKIKDHVFQVKNINIAKQNIIAVLKMSSISQRSTIRDYFDLYYLVRYHIKLEELIQITKKYLPHLPQITFSETLVYLDDIEEDNIADHLYPEEIITKDKIADFFKNELRKLCKK